jgi:hypothetical protein
VSRKSQESPLQLRYDLASARVLLWVAGAGRRGEMRREVHLFLADRYGRLALYYRSQGNVRKANRIDARAAWHYAAGGPPPPSAAAMAMPIPRPPARTSAIGVPDPPDDVA